MSVFEDPKAIIAWFDRIRSERHNTEWTWQEIADHALGTRDFTIERTPGRIRNEGIYDTTSMFAHQLLSGALHGMLTNPATDWFDMQPKDPGLRLDLDGQLWLSDAKEKMLSIFRGQASNFVTQAAESYLDISGFGMAGFSVMPRKGGGVAYMTHPLREIFVTVNDERQVDTVFRCCTLTARQWAQRWPNDTDTKIERALERGDPETRFKIIQLIAPSDDPYAGRSPFSMPWTNVVVAYENPRVLESGGFREKPLLTPRWSVEPGEVYGRGPGWLALAEQKMLNQMARTILTAAQKASDPPLLVTNEAVLSGIRTRPGGVNIVQQLFGQAGAGEPIRPLANNAQHQLSVEMLNARQQQVRNAFFAQVLQLYSDPRMTATQVLELTNQTQRLMAPMLGRLQSEFLEPVVDRTFNILLRQGYFLPIPSSLAGADLDITYVSPVARAQRAAEARAIIETWQAAALVTQATGSADALDVLNVDESIRRIHAANNAPPEILTDLETVAAMREGRAQQQQQMAQLEGAQAGANVVRQLAGAERELAQAA